MLNRKIEKRINDFYQNNKKALLITGARQVGKTYTIRKFANENYSSFIEINFLENKIAKELFEKSYDSSDLLMKLSVITNKPLIKNETLIFLDEIQECKEIITAIKFLVEEGSYKYILSGSLLGVDLKDIRSIPVGYMDIFEMYPLDFEEFIIANGVSKDIIDYLLKCYSEKKCVDEIVHKKMLSLFSLYLIVGGMPAVVMKYIETNNIQLVIQEQQSIIQLYKKDISKYDGKQKLYLEEIYDLIPSELNSKNKRFVLNKINENFKLSRNQNSFIWLKDAGVALQTSCVSEPVIPLKLSKMSNLFKLFLSDVGLLASMYMNNIQIKILNHEIDINYGSVYENVVAQELKAHNFDLYYFNSKKQGEVDFLIELNDKILPIEIKSGKDYAKHSALNNLLNNKNYNIDQALVLYNGNVKTIDSISYLPIYMMMFIKKQEIANNFIYKIDIEELK